MVWQATRTHEIHLEIIFIWTSHWPFKIYSDGKSICCRWLKTLPDGWIFDFVLDIKTFFRFQSCKHDLHSENGPVPHTNSSKFELKFNVLSFTWKMGREGWRALVYLVGCKMALCTWGPSVTYGWLLGHCICPLGSPLRTYQHNSALSSSWPLPSSLPQPPFSLSFFFWRSTEQPLLPSVLFPQTILWDSF